MSEEKTSNPISAITKPIGEIVATATVVAAYIQGIFKVADTKIPNTVSLLLIVVTSIFVIGRRWGKLSEKRKKKPNNGSSKEKTKGSLREQILEPFKESKNDPYALSLPRRRFEAGFIAALTVFTVGWTGFNISSAVTELTSDPALTCSIHEGENNLLVVVADVKETGEQQLLVSSKTYNELVNNQAGSLYNVCRWDGAFDVNTDALNKAKELKADIMIWGIKDAATYEMHVEVPVFANHDRKVSEVASDEVASSDFQINEVKHIHYVVEFTLSEILFLNKQAAEAQFRLKDAIDRAEQLDHLDTTNPKALAKGYFLLGLLYDPGYSLNADRARALTAYETAFEWDPELYAARFNRGLILMNTGKVDEAVAEFTFVIEHDGRLKVSALINRASLLEDPEARLRDLNEAIKLDAAEGYFFRGLELYQQEDYKGAIRDFEKAVAADPEGYYNYHLLGQAQLYAGETDAAKLTYVSILPTLDEDTRAQVISELEEDAAYSPEIAPTVEEIVLSLRQATLP